MLRKKTNYEKKGLVRQITGSIFASQKDKGHQDEKWRPRKTLFERLDGDDIDGGDDNDIIHRAFSVESETQEYRRGILFDKKKIVFEHNTSKKRDLGNIMIKPSARDRPNTRLAVGTRIKKAKKDSCNAFHDPFGLDPFASNAQVRSDESVDDSAVSRHTSSSKHTSSTRNTALHTVSSDPSNFFSRQPMKLTKSNLDLMTSMSSDLPNSVSEENGIENINPRSKFHQFTIEEDKESTVILPVTYLGDGASIVDSQDEDLFEEDSQYSLGVTSKGTQIQKGIPRIPTATANAKEDTGATFFGSEHKTSDMERTEEVGVLQPGFENSFFSEFGATVEGNPFFDTDKETKETYSIKPAIRRHPSQQFQSTHSLVYSESSCEDTNDASSARKTSKWTSIRKQTPGRTPLSPLNIEPRYRFSTDSIAKYGKDNFSKTKPDPDASWAVFSESTFEKKPDPTAKVSTPLEFFEDATKSPEASADSFETSKEKWNNSFEKLERGPKAVLEKTRMFSSTNLDVWGRQAIPEDRPVDEEDEDDDITDVDPEYEYGFTKKSAFITRPIGIQSFPNGIISRSYSSSSSQSSRRVEPTSSQGSLRRSSHDKSQGSTSYLHKYRYGYSGDHDSRGSHSRSHHDKSLCSHGLPKSRCCHIGEHECDDDDSLGKHSTSSASFTKPLGLPNNAIMASMLFRRHHNIDTQVVEAKLKAKEQEYKTDRSRGDIPQSVQAVDGISCVSSFSEDTAAQIEAWRKPTKDLLEHFSRSRRTEFDYKKHLKEQRTDATELFEA